MARTFTNQAVDLSKLDSVQAKLLSEMVIVVDEDDNQIGADTKKNCHLMTNINTGFSSPSLHNC